MNTTTNKTGTARPKKKDATFGADSGLQEKIMKQIRELGDSIERAGERVERSGWESIGQAIYKLGNSLEHLNKKSAGKAYTDKEFDEKTKKTSDLKASTGKVGGDESQAY
jgi:hypothetical protein